MNRFSTGDQARMFRRAAAASAVLIAAAAADDLACHALLGRMRTAYAQWTQDMRAQGWQVTDEGEKGQLTGLGATLVLKDLRLAGGRAILPGGLSWHASRLELSLSLLHPRRLTIAPQAEQKFRLAGGPPLVVSASLLTAAVPLGNGHPDRLDISAEQLTAGIARTDQRQALQIASAELHLQAAPGGGSRTDTTLVLQARGIGLPDDGRWPLGATIGRLSANISLSSPVLSGAAPVEQARAWRDWGGALQLRQCTLHWGPLDLSLQGSLHLDQDLQPEGAGTARVTGGGQALTALAQGGTIPDGIAQTAQVMLGLIARPVAGSDGLELPVALKHATLSVGKLPLLSVPPVAWGGA